MSDNNEVLLSVRGEARQTVAPDVAVLAGGITAARSFKADAIRATASALDDLTAELARLGGVSAVVEARFVADGVAVSHICSNGPGDQPG